MPLLKANNIQICYETFGLQTNPALILIGGLGWQLTSWEDAFCHLCVDAGFFVVRFDNRDTGFSSWFTEHGVPDIEKMLEAKRNNRSPDAPYSLDDMAADVVGLMDGLELKDAHLCGISMGGMIAQAVAINYPQRTLSLISIGSTTGNPAIAVPRGEAIEVSTADRINDREAAAKRALDLNRVAGSPAFPVAKERLMERAYRDFDRAFNAQGVARQIAAVLAHGDRRSGLRRLKVKALIIHGLSDPLVPPENAADIQENTPGSELMVIDGMGHDLPEGVWPRIITAIQGLLS